MDNAFIAMDVDEWKWPITGSNFSPSSTACSRKIFFFFSRSAWTVVFCTVNSLSMDIASWKATFAACCCWRTISTLPAKAANTAEARAPFSPISAKTGASVSMPPNSCKRLSNMSSPSLVLRLHTSANSLTAMPVALAIFSGDLKRFMIILLTAVEDISSF